MNMKFTRILKMLLVLALSTSITSCDEFFAIFDDPVESTDPVTPPEPEPEPESNPEPPYASDLERPLTLKALENGTISVTFNGGIVLAEDIHYTINYGAERTIAKNTSGTYEITVKKDYVVEMYSTNKSLGADGGAAVRNVTRAIDSGAKYINIKPSMKTEIFGNVMSLLKGKDNFATADAIEANNAFYGLFAGAEKLVNSTERQLVLPATTLKEGCYQDMFNGCKGLEKAPELPAPTLGKDCYKEMFYDCSKLNHVACLATDISAPDCTKDWLAKAGTEATGDKILEIKVDMPLNSDDGVPESWIAKKIVLVESVRLDKTELALTIGDDAVQLTATVLPDDAIDKTVTWTSSKPAVSTVDETGKVTPVAVGEATITATAGDKTATCKITVKESGSISFSKESDSKTWSATATNNTYQLAATVTGNGTVTYSVNTDNTCGATIDATGTVTFTKVGTVTVTATVADSETYTYASNTASYTLTIDPATMTVTATNYSNTYDTKAHGITVNAPTGATVKYGTTSGTYNLTENPTYTNAGTYTVYYEVTQANYTTVTGSATVTISKAAGTISFAKDSESKLNTDAAFTNTLTNTGDGTVTYSSDKTSVAEVNTSTGEVTIKGVGTATITATVTDGTNYTYATNTAKYTLTVSGQPSIIDREGYGQGDNPF